MTVKRAIGKIHLWLGLTTGLVVFVVALTGCIYVFADEITHALRKEARHVQPLPAGPLPVSQIWGSVQAITPEHELSGVIVQNDPKKSWKFYSYAFNDDALTYFGSVAHYESIYVDPYTGKMTGRFDEEYDFFNVIKFLHWSLLLETSIGQPIVGWSTFIFVIMIITGLVLWWPKKKNARKQRFWFRWKSSTQWKRKNYDLHNITGFYLASILLMIAFTGMVWAFSWFQSLVYVIASGSVTAPDIPRMTSSMSHSIAVSPMDSAFAHAKTLHPTAFAFSIYPPSDSSGVYHVYIQQKEGVYYISHELQVDQYSGALLANRTHEDKNFGEQVITANYDIHVGAILGLPGKILAFITSFFCSTLPVTGFYIWWGRKFKSSTRKKEMPVRKKKTTADSTTEMRLKEEALVE